MKILYNLFAISGSCSVIWGLIVIIISVCMEQYDRMPIAIGVFISGVIEICLHRQLYNDVQTIRDLTIKVDYLMSLQSGEPEHDDEIE